MARIPAPLLPFRLTVRKIAANSSEGDTLAAPIQVQAQYEEHSVLKLDARADAETFGTRIVMNHRVITQIEDWLPVGTKVTTPFGDTVTVANSSRYPSIPAPANAEMWCV